MPNEISQKEEDKYHTISLICGIWKRINKWIYKTKTKQTHRYRKQAHGCQRGEGWNMGKN